MTGDLIGEVLGARENRLEQLIETLPASPDPLVLYGAGATATQVYGYLRERGVPLHAVAVDHAPEAAKFGDHPLVSLADLAGAGRPFHFLLGFVPVREDAGTIARRLQAQVPGRLTALDFSGLSFGAASPAQIDEHADALRSLSEWLGDDLSRRTLTAYLQARLTFDPAWLDGIYRGDQYFPADLVTLGDGEHFVDAGAYDGDTLTDFTRRTGQRYGSIRAFEPDPLNFRKLQATVAKLSLPNCDLRNAGTWEHTGELSFRGANARLSGLDTVGEVHVRVEAIDDVLNGETVSFIKMDVEGAELASLKGARRSIEQHQPRLAICLYHKIEDLVTIPAWIRQVLPASRCFLRLHTRFSQELVLYALP